MIHLLAIATAYLLVSSYQDFKTREVDDRISDSFIALAILIQAFPILQGSYRPFLWALGLGLILFAFGWVMFQTGQWGGADVKILTALGILFANVDGFMFDYFINIFLIAFVYSIAYSLYLAYGQPKVLKVLEENLRRDMGELYKILGMFVLSLLIIASAIHFTYVVGTWELFLLMVPLMVLFVLLPAFWLLLKFVQVIETVCFRLKAKANDLREFDLLTESLVRVGKKIARIPEGEELKGKIIVNCKDPNGLTLEQIEDIKKLTSAKRLKDGFVIKWGLPFVPVFLIALYFTLWGGNGLLLVFGLR